MKNSIDELFVEGICNVFGLNVCVVFECYGVVVECYGVVVLLWWSFVC